jgi:hypothetical protein
VYFVKVFEGAENGTHLPPKNGTLDTSNERYLESKSQNAMVKRLWNICLKGVCMYRAYCINKTLFSSWQGFSDCFRLARQAPSQDP